MVLTKLKALIIGYAPKDRNYAGAMKKINAAHSLIKTNKTLDAAKKLGIKERTQKIFNKKELNQILKIILATGFDNVVKTSKNFDWVFKRKVKSSDSIKQAKTKSIILKGIKKMKASNDPAHDFSHIMRCLRFSEFMLNNTRLELDWGVLVTAIVWHDIARVDNQGILYQKRFRWFRKTPVIRDLSLFGIYIRDAYESVLIVHKEFKKEIKELNNTINFYKKEIKQDKKIITELQDSLQLEKFAREKYLMKKENEDIYIIEFDTLKK